MSAAADSGFHDSEFDWDALPEHDSPEPALRSRTGMDLLAWVVLVLLTFCPPVGYAIALLWWP